MRSTNLVCDMDYIMYKNLQEDRMYNALTSDYMFKCDNYAVAYMLTRLLYLFPLCEHSDITEDCFFPYSKVIFITCRPRDIERIKCVAKHIPSSIEANIKIYDENEEEV